MRQNSEQVDAYRERGYHLLWRARGENRAGHRLQGG